MIRVSPSDLDQIIWYNRIEAMTAEELTARLRRETPPEPHMLAGSAWHDFLENHPAGIVENGEYEWQGFRFQINLDDEVAIELPQAREAFGARAIVVDGEEVELRCKADGITGGIVNEYKLSKNGDVETRMESLQWKAYLYVFSAYAARYTVFKRWQRGFLVKIEEVSETMLYRYPTMMDDLRAGIREYVAFCRQHCPDVLQPKPRRK